MSNEHKLQEVKNYIHIHTVYYMNLLLDKDLPDFKKNYLQGRLDMLKAMNKELFDGKAQLKLFD
jgi:hypothetical protein